MKSWPVRQEIYTVNFSSFLRHAAQFQWRKYSLHLELETRTASPPRHHAWLDRGLRVSGSVQSYLAWRILWASVCEVWRYRLLLAIPPIVRRDRHMRYIMYLPASMDHFLPPWSFSFDPECLSLFPVRRAARPLRFRISRFSFLRLSLNRGPCSFRSPWAPLLWSTRRLKRQSAVLPWSQHPRTLDFYGRFSVVELKCAFFTTHPLTPIGLSWDDLFHFWP